MKKLLSAALVTVMLVISVPVGAFAETDGREKGTIEFPTGGFLQDEAVPVKVIDAADIKSEDISLMAVPNQNIYEYLEAQMRAHVQEITIYPTYKIDPDDLRTILRNVLFNNYDIFVLDKLQSFYITTDNNRDYAYSFAPVYYTPEEGEAQAIAMMDAEIGEYLDAVSDIPSDDVIGKMIVIYDLFCKNNEYAKQEYDEEVSTNGTILHNETRLAYWVFKYNRAVCQGNVIALAAIYDALNEQLKQETGSTDDFIEMGFCSSDRKKHVWKVGGQWYHMDETWDDPVLYLNGEIYDGGYSRNSYFLRSYAGMADHLINNVDDWVYYTKGHESSVMCDDDGYESGYLFNAYSSEYVNDGQLITYEDGRYKLTVEYPNANCPFISDSLKTTKILASDPYFAAGASTGRIYFLFTEAATVRQIGATYTQDGSMDNFRVMSRFSGSKGISGKSYTKPTRSTYLFFRPEDDFSEPLCRKILLSGSVQ